AEVDATDHQFAIACFDQRIYFAQDFLQRQRSAVAAHVGDYAEGTAVVASILNFEVGSGSLAVMSIAERIEYRSGQQFGVSENIGNEDAGFGFRLAASGCEAG